jgi:hypothetical protein
MARARRILVDILNKTERPPDGDGQFQRPGRRQVGSQQDLRRGNKIFDTLYHALALERNALLVTANDRYLRKAEGLGKVVASANWKPSAAAANV